MKRDLLALLMRDEDPSRAALARAVVCARRGDHLPVWRAFIRVDGGAPRARAELSG